MNRQLAHEHRMALNDPKPVEVWFQARRACGPYVGNPHLVACIDFDELPDAVVDSVLAYGSASQNVAATPNGIGGTYSWVVKASAYA
jgi:hypothetical protein